jgi:hypothetical protein
MLKQIDYEFAIKVKAKGCRCCKGKLDWASFPRKPRGIESLQSERRLSFCCRSCRKRVTPNSARFLWKKVYVLLVVAVEPVTGIVGVCRRTVERWRRWWQSELCENSLFCVHFRYCLPVEFSFDLGSLIEVFKKTDRINFIALSRFLSPLGCAPRLRFYKFRAEDAF